MDLAAFLKARLDEDEFEAGQVICEWHDNDRRRREVEAKRAILGAYAFQSRYDDGIGRVLAHTFHEVLRVLAAVYSDHPDYDPAWATQPHAGR